jgi:peptide-methionine (S)-S-oxide reductase
MACAAFLSLSVPLSAQQQQATLVLAGGCFWGVEYVFEHLRGVTSVTSGYAQYNTRAARSEAPIEAVRIVYDPVQISHRQLLDVFFTVAHDPTSRDRQGPDAGPEYRAVAFFASNAERDSTEAFRNELAAKRRFTRTIVTEIQPLAKFTIAEAFHQDFAERNPNDPYIVRNDRPKLLQLRQLFPALYQEQRAP